ncbi:MAG: RiPP maturation radical SAM C-methyltransferase [bacterium]
MNTSNDIESQGRLLLISMPFSNSIVPSIQLGTLSSYLKSKGISVDSHHAYLKCADILTPKLYNIISSTMIDEIFYPYFLFPKNFYKYRKRIKRYFNSFVIKKEQITLETVLDRLNSFNEELLTGIDFSKYSLIGFSVTYDQLKPSIYLARKIKQRHPNIKIVFGGALCTGDLGISLLKTFPVIDFIVSGEGEETLASLFRNLDKGGLDKIKGLIWRDNGTVKFNGPPEALSLDSLLIPEFDDYFSEMEGCSSDLKNFIRNYLSIPVEGSRGCWWSKCTFCNLNSQYSRYREKSVERIIYEVRELVNRYQCHSIRFMDNVQRIKDFDKLMSGLKNLNMDLNMLLEIRAGRLKKEDYRLMRDAGVKVVQIGIEAFGNKCLKKMNKGVTTIENIAAVKNCQEHDILVFYNVIINYPNEDQSDLEETIENVNFLKSFIPPYSVHPMRLCHGSPVYNNLEKFNIKEKKLIDNAQWRFPKEIWQTLTPFYYDYTCINDRKDRILKWQEIFRAWQQTGENRIFSPLLFYQDAGEFLTITDRLSEKGSKTILKGIERELYLFCDSIQTKPDILKRFPDLSADHLEGILERWINLRWMFREGERFLSLAVRITPMLSSVACMPDYKKMFKIWNQPLAYREFRLKAGTIADINLSINFHKKPAWLRRLKRMLTFR